MGLAELELHPEAVAEAKATREWYAERSPRAAARFVIELDGALGRIREFPDLWPSYLHGTRRCLLHHFPYQIVYRQLDDVIQVVAVAHCRRRPGYWRHR
ncbi:MAG: hypothetical protein AUJ92_14165 [Armatimonadetes bacterium CG2_30_59_28]|nr:MAG: hypothetical protein AUJ92_14165 [Armatimonadetes bacterium CG2_30_59_28]PIU60420.1 MAG: hypothetical protein COS85_24515 [Armatimonadetes bacterium CG07_land_8_20_14_0_80_59_28]PIX44269.1 MAG: hypothetical protein COZ56_05090 [Armatimonadetes bacterium CG_4_8_14_3_um_filter_58_9]PJB76588.1 MAG: hypothetical protein CO095_02315 [Armatimonadetes bacterium CG_4_9_14_3_um_filter_58_7]